MPQFRPAHLSDEDVHKIYLYMVLLEQSPDVAAEPIPAAPIQGGSLAQGKYLFTLTCATCHEADGKGRELPFVTVPSILGTTKENLVAAVRQPPPGMIPFTPEELTNTDLDNIYQYILTLEKAG